MKPCTQANAARILHECPSFKRLTPFLLGNTVAGRTAVFFYLPSVPGYIVFRLFEGTLKAIYIRLTRCVRKKLQKVHTECYIYLPNTVPRWVYVRLLDIVLMLKELIRGMPSVKMRSCNRGRRVSHCGGPPSGCELVCSRQGYRSRARQLISVAENCSQRRRE